MFRKILLSLMFSSIVFGADISKDDINFANMATTDGIVIQVRNLIDDINTELRNTSGRYSNVGTGNIYYVDSAVGSDTYTGTSPRYAVATWDAAVALCDDNNGDVIVGIQNHAENLSAADGVDVDIAGVLCLGLGDGTDAPEFSYTQSAGEFVVGAANVVLYNLRFLAATGSITMGISIEDAGDNCTIMNCEFPEPATITDEFLDAIDLAGEVDDFRIFNCVYRHVSTTGPAHFIEAGNGHNDDMMVVGNDIAGEFSVSAIWSDTVDMWTIIRSNQITNLTSGQHAIEFTAAAEGMISYNAVYCSSSANAIDPGSMACIENYVTEAADQSGFVYPAKPYGL